MTKAKKRPSSSQRLQDMEAGDGVAGSGAESDTATSAAQRSQGRPPLPPSLQNNKGWLAGLHGDEYNMALLVLLYMLQGVPLGLSMGSVPFLLKAHSSFTQIGLFSIAAYPYSFKLLWSPIVDSVYNKAFGRRKSWIVPIQAVSGVVMALFASQAEEWVNKVNTAGITSLFFVLVLLAATQDIAVDGWALELLSKRNLGHTSTCQTLGMNIGYFLSFTVFLALSDGQFCTNYICREPCPDGFVTLGSYLRMWGVVYVVVTIALALLKPERPPHGDAADAADNGSLWPSLKASYLQLWEVIKLPAVLKLAFVLVTCRLGVITVESAGPFKLIDKGMMRETLSMLVLLQFPVELVFAVVAGRWASKGRAFDPWLTGFWARTGLGVATTLMVWVFPRGATPSANPFVYFVLVVLAILSSMSSTLMFVSSGTFYAKISDSSMGGAYLTLLNTIANMGVVLPKLGIFWMIDQLTVYQCIQKARPRIDMGIMCKVESHGEDGLDDACSEAGGECEIKLDGFYILSLVMISMSVGLGLVYSRLLPSLEGLELGRWRGKAKDAV